MVNIEEKFEGLAQDIWNENYPEDKKWNYALYLFNALEARYENIHYPIDNLVDDMNKLYPDLAINKDLNLPPEGEIHMLKYFLPEKYIIEEVLEQDNGYRIKFDGWMYYVLKKKYGAVPKKGDEIIIWLYFSEVKGFCLNGKMLFPETDREWKKDELLKEQKIRKKFYIDDMMNFENIWSLYKELPIFLKKEIDDMFSIERFKCRDTIKKMIDESNDYNKKFKLFYYIKLYSDVVRLVKSEPKIIIESLKDYLDQENLKEIDLIVRRSGAGPLPQLDKEKYYKLLINEALRFYEQLMYFLGLDE